MYRFIALFICIFISIGQYVHANQERNLTYFVTDQTGTLSDYELKELDNQIQLLEQKNDIQAKVLLVKSTQPESIESYAEDVFATTKLGDAGKDNGLLLLIALEDRKMRFEVGYGLEGRLTDLQTAQIIRDSLAPAFRKNQISKGISAAINSLGKILSGSTTETHLSLGNFEEDRAVINNSDETENTPFINPITQPIFLIIFVILQIVFRVQFKAKRKAILMSIFPAFAIASIMFCYQNLMATTEMVITVAISFVSLYILTYFLGDRVVNILINMNFMRLSSGSSSGAYSNDRSSSSSSRSRSSSRSSSSSSRSRSSGRGGRSGGGGSSGSW